MILTRASQGERLSAAEGVRLLREGSFFELGLAADAVRRRRHPDGVVTYIVDRNVNYTNVCTTSCRFCAFYRPVGHAEGYVLSRDVLGQKLQEVVDAGGVQILLQGGLNPELRIDSVQRPRTTQKPSRRPSTSSCARERSLSVR